jgi:hypothetical protein
MAAAVFLTLVRWAAGPNRTIPHYSLKTFSHLKSHIEPLHHTLIRHREMIISIS